MKEETGKPPLHKRISLTLFCLLPSVRTPLPRSTAKGLPRKLGTGAPLPVAPYRTGRARTAPRNTSVSPLSPQRSARLAGASLEGFGRPAAEKAKQSSDILSTLAEAVLKPPFLTENQQKSH